MIKKKITKEEYLVTVINSIQDKYKALRSKSKGPSFALQYQGTWFTLVNRAGFEKEEAKRIEQAYKEAFKVSIDFIQDKLIQASKIGYVDLAYGGRLLTPVLANTVYGSKALPYEAEEEGRSAGNAIIQSYCFLNVETLTRFMNKVWNSPYALKILPIASIHDANYFLIENTLGCIEFFNRIYIETLQEYSLPELQHPDVKLGGNVEIYYPSWAEPLILPNTLSLTRLLALGKQHLENL